MNDPDRINRQTSELKAENERLAKRKDGIYYAISIFLALTALTIALFGLLR